MTSSPVNLIAFLSDPPSLNWTRDTVLIQHVARVSCGSLCLWSPFMSGPFRCTRDARADRGESAARCKTCSQLGARLG